MITDVQTRCVPPLASDCTTLSINVLFLTRWGSHYIGYYSFVDETWYCYHTSATIGFDEDIVGWWYLPTVD